MAITYTENYNLGKQEDHNDKFDMSVLTDNADKIDEALTGKVDKATRIAGIDLSTNISVAELQTALLEGTYVTPKMFGAKGDSITDDTEALQNFADYISDSGIKGIVESGEYIISSPLVFKCPNINGANISEKNKHFEIIGSGTVTIRKINNVTFNEKDTIFYIKNIDDNAYSYNVIVKGIDLIGCGTGTYLASNANEFGIYVEQSGIFYGIFEDILIRGVQDGVKGAFYMTRFTRTSCYSSRYGFAINAGTSLSFNNCYCQLQQTSAYYLYLCEYTTLISCGADGVNGTAYDINFGTATLVNCGSENLYGEHIFNIKQSYVSIEGGCYLASPNIDDAVSILLSLNARVSLNNARISTHYNITDSSPDIAKGKLFTVESLAYVIFNDCYICQYEQDSNWDANFSHKRTVMADFETAFDVSKNILTYKDKNGVIRDSNGNPAEPVYFINQGEKIAEFIVLGDTNNYTISHDESGIIVDGGNTTGQTNAIYLVFPVSVYNFTKFTIVSSLESSYQDADGADGGVSYFLAKGEQIENLNFANPLLIKNQPYLETTNTGTWKSIIPQIYGRNLFAIRIKTQPFGGQSAITHKFTLKSLKFE